MNPTSTSGNGGAAELFSKKASFIQHSLPGLQAGTYQLKAQQELRDSGGKLITTAQLTAVTRQFGVKGPKYALDATAVESVYPPVASVGGFSMSLAHVVLNQEKLPWLRSPYLPQNVVTPAELTYQVGTRTIQYDDDQPTWLMVLTLSPSDVGGQDPLSLIKRGTVLDLVPGSLQMQDGTGKTAPGQLPASGYSIFSYLLQAPVSSAPVSPEFGNTAADPCQYIDVPVNLFKSLAPSMDDLKMMAHVRAVEMTAKPLRQDEVVQPVQQYGLVLGNRLPETFDEAATTNANAPAPGHNVAFLVSLECMELALRNCQLPNNQYPIITGSTGFVRLIVLNQWSFTSWANKSYQFEQLLKGLNGRDPQAGNSAAPLPNPLLRLPNPPQFTAPTQEQVVVQQMLELGYMPLNHLTRVPAPSTAPTPQIQTVSWYRGPLVPLAQTPTLRFANGVADGPAEPVYSADKLLRFDPVVGMYDTAYAAAWQLGQLTALQNKTFSVPYFRWQKNNAQKFRVHLENELLSARYAGLLNRSLNLRASTSEAGTARVAAGAEGPELAPVNNAYLASGQALYQSVLDSLTNGI